MKDKTYLRSDIKRIIKSLGKTTAILVSISYNNDAILFKAGYDAALIAVADAFGIDSFDNQFNDENNVIEGRL